MKHIIIGSIAGLLVVAILLGLGFFIGVHYGVQETSKIYCDGLGASIGQLDIGEQSTEFALNGPNYGEYDGVKFVVTRTK